MRSNQFVALLAGTAMALVLASGAATNAAPKKSKATTSKQELAQSTPTTANDANNNTNAAPAPDPTTVAGKVREILISSGKGDRLVSRKGERQVVDAFYQKRSYEPMWIDGGKASAKAEAVLAYIKTIDADGLEPTDYVFPNLAAASLDGQAEAEVKFTATLLTYARHALNGRVHWSRISPWIYYKDNYNAAEVLEQIAGASNIASAMDALNPQQAEYKALKAKLVDLRAQKAEAPAPRLPYGPYLKYGNSKSSNDKGKSKTAKDKDKAADESVTMMKDPRVPLLREKLGLPAKDDTYYDKELAEAAAKFQDGHGLKPDGEIGNPTIDALNGPPRDTKVNIVLANMERWRWLPRDLGKTHVVLNIPEFTLKVWHDDTVVWTTRVVVGKVGHETPLLSETMKFITVNPTWNVPESIVYNELLPIYETSNPNIFAQQGLKVEQGKDGIRVYQPPGDRNALGRVRFNFPNKFLVYQHDTPEKHLFAKETRAYSHGCMRVQDPVRYAEVLLGYAVKDKYTQDRIRKMFGDSEITIDFTTQIPVHVTYQTAFVDSAGVLQFRDDVYGLDAKLLSQLKGSERKVADVVMDRPANPNYRPSPTDFARLDNVPREGGYSGYSGRGSDPFAGFFRIFR
jgi:L,D-transpeptidase YcbB